MTQSDSPIRHIIVLMLENRSFDHMLGYACSELAIPFYLPSEESRALATGEREHDLRRMTVQERGEAVGNLGGNRHITPQLGGGSVVTNYAERADDLVRAVNLLRERGMTVSFPMQTPDGEMIFAVDKDFTLTAHEMLELLEGGELHAEGVRKLVEGKAVPAPVRRQAASS